jgi:hypothetical protein
MNEEDKVPCSQRHVDGVGGVVNSAIVRGWDEIVDLEQQRVYMERLYRIAQHLPECGYVTVRPSLFNLLFEGPRGSGRFTLACAFCKHFGIGLVEVDMTDMYAVGVSDAGKLLLAMVQGGEQGAIKLVYVRNFLGCELPYQRKLLQVVEGLPAELAVFLVLETEPGSAKHPLLAEFTTLTFPSVLPKRAQLSLLERYEGHIKNRESIERELGLYPAGVTVRHIESLILLQDVE